MNDLATTLTAGNEPADLVAMAALIEAARQGDMQDPYLLAQLGHGWALLALHDKLDHRLAADDGRA